jgi:hypothetical protein
VQSADLISSTSSQPQIDYRVRIPLIARENQQTGQITSESNQKNNTILGGKITQHAPVAIEQIALAFNYAAITQL